MCAKEFPLVSMGGWAEGQACANTGARTPIDASGFFFVEFCDGNRSLKNSETVHYSITFLALLVTIYKIFGPLCKTLKNLGRWQGCWQRSRKQQLRGNQIYSIRWDWWMLSRNAKRLWERSLPDSAVWPTFVLSPWYAQKWAAHKTCHKQNPPYC